MVGFKGTKPEKLITMSRGCEFLIIKDAQAFFEGVKGGISKDSSWTPMLMKL